MKKTLFLIALGAILLTPGVGAATAAEGLDRSFRAEQVNGCEKKRWICVQDLGPSPRRTWRLNSCDTDYTRCVGR
ncbi:hypothetical protein GJ654_04625 [Rhodoblastus acidophilus]|uniref:Uncharacterized protein n=1 Tax=Rhodoblastus acidophilus TaxID=1074 RepID=A0A6N8DL75_RHOAC|nr:hypothetical protein [Rhodoblastus acidophilus]MCW2273641.1 hypothetical protein [Rhodoblastus acidophilus]MTV30275.1 hypothetical protein [Rhodoblastus acidophilus]